MAFQTAKEYLEKRGFGDRIKEFDVSSATVELAAVAVGCEPAHIAKTLSFLTGEGPILIVAAGDAKIDNHKYKSFFGVKAKMLTVDQVSEMIGHEVGGVCPYGIKEGVKVYLDEVDALEYAIKISKKDDIIIVFYENIEPLLNYINNNEQERINKMS